MVGRREELVIRLGRGDKGTALKDPRRGDGLGEVRIAVGAVRVGDLLIFAGSSRKDFAESHPCAASRKELRMDQSVPPRKAGEDSLSQPSTLQ